MQVTVSGGSAVGPVVLNFGANDLAVVNAQALAALIDANYTTPIVYSGGKLTGTATTSLLIQDRNYGNIKATGFGAIIDDNNNSSNTIVGGGDLSGTQYVLASDGGLKFIATTGAVDIAVGGGDNDISFAGDISAVQVYIGGGDNTVKGGDGATTISAGGGDNTIKLGAGNSLVDATGQDTVFLGSGAATVDASLDSFGVAVKGATASGGAGYTLTFIGGAAADTVRGGTGSYSVVGGTGGGVFFGGSGGGNYIDGGAGLVTITGGGSGDTLIGGATGDIIRAAIGNETLTGGADGVTFSFKAETNSLTNDAGNVVIITDFNSTDTLMLGSKAADTYATNHETVIGGNTDFFLQDGTKVVLQGFTSTVKFH